MDLDRLGDYQLLRPLARGGMAELFLARRRGRGDEVVVKRALPHLASNNDVLALFREEARVAGGLKHPNIVRLLDAGEADGAPFLVMEYLAGKDLAAVIRRGRKLGYDVPPAVAARIAVELCRALDYVHRAKEEDGEPLGIVHRDVSPANVLLTCAGQVKLLDFGIAGLSGAAVEPGTGMVRGKCAYLSPEQARGLALDGRADLFSLGAVLYELLTGARLFQRDDRRGTLAAVADAPVPSPSVYRSDIPAALERIVLRALERDLDRRFPSASAMAEALETFLATGDACSTRGQVRRLLVDLFGRSRAAVQSAPPSGAPRIRKARVRAPSPLSPAGATGAPRDARV